MKANSYFSSVFGTRFLQILNRSILVLFPTNVISFYQGRNSYPTTPSWFLSLGILLCSPIPFESIHRFRFRDFFYCELVNDFSLFQKHPVFSSLNNKVTLDVQVNVHVYWLYILQLRFMRLSNIHVVSYVCLKHYFMFLPLYSIRS